MATHKKLVALQELAAKALNRDADYPVVEFEKEWYCWGDFRQVADAVDQLMDKSGINPESYIAFLPCNRPGVLAALIGCLRRGQSIKMINVYQPAAGIANDIQRLKPSLIIGDEKDFSSEVEAAIVARGIAAISFAGMKASALEGSKYSTAECDSTPVPQIELLTSGTTGPPKQFPLTFELIARDMVGVNTMQTAQQLDPVDLPPLYFYLSFSNISGIYLIIPALLSGIRGVLVDRFRVPTWHDYVMRYKPVFIGLPLPSIRMIMDANLPPQDLSSLKGINTGAAMLDPELHRAFEERYGIAILLVYGATETGGPVSMMTYDLYQKWGKKKFGSLGRPFNQAKLRIVDSESGNVLPFGQKGLLEIQTDRIGPEWIRTSDICVLDEDEFLYFHGRADGAINRGGFKIIPESVENALKQHVAIADASVVGKPDPRLGEVPVAAIVVRPGSAAPDFNDLEAFLRERVPATNIPVDWRIIDEMPYTNTMKIHRGTIKSLFEAG